METGFKISRGENGQVKFQFNNANSEIAGLGKVQGSGTFSVGNTGQVSNETVAQIGQTQDESSLLVVVDDDIDNIQFYGDNLEAKFNSNTEKEYNVQWDATNSTLDSSKGAGSMLITTGENSSNNTFKLGDAGQETTVSGLSFDNYIVDNGKNNTFISNNKTGNYFETTESSEGAVIFGGDNSNVFLLGGDKSTVVGGKSNDTFITSDTASENIMIGMDGNDQFADYGERNLIAGGKGKDTLDANGKGLLANLGNDEDATVHIGKGTEGNAIFTGAELKASDLTVYNYQDYLNDYLDKNGLSMAEFQAKVGLDKDASVVDIINALKGEV